MGKTLGVIGLGAIGILGKVVFVRMPSDATQLETKADWATAWNQTDNLTTEGNVFTVTGWESKEGKDYMTGEWSNSSVSPTTATNNEGTYTATLNTGSYTSDGSWFVFTWTNNGYPGHWVEGTKTGQTIKFSGLCNRVIFASFKGVTELPDDDWTGRVAQTDTLTTHIGGTYTVSGKEDGFDGYNTPIKRYLGAWSGGTAAPEAETSTTPAGVEEGNYSAFIDLGKFESDGTVFAWTWTWGEVNGHWVAGIVSRGAVSFSGLNNRVIFATFESIPAGELPDKSWTGKVAQTDDLSLMHGGTYVVSGKEEREKGDYYTGTWEGGVAVPDEPNTKPKETDLGTYKAKLNTGVAEDAGDWYAWTWNTDGAPGHWIEGTKNEDGTITFDALCENVKFGAFKGAPLKDWSNRAGQTLELTVVNTATYTIDEVTEGIDEVSGEDITIYLGSWSEPEATTEEATTEPVEETTAPATEPEATTEPVEETTVPATEPETTEAPTTAPETTTAAPTTEAVETTEAPTTTAPEVTTVPETEPETTEAPTTVPEATTAPATEAEPATTAPVVSLNVNSKSLKAGKSFKLSVNGTKETPSFVVFSGQKNVMVDAKGNVTALKKGEAVVMVVAANKILNCKVKVTSNPALKYKSKAFKKSKTYTVKKKGKITFKITGRVKSIANSVKVKDKKRVKVLSKKKANKIVLKGLKKGKTTVTVKINKYKSYKIKIKVK